MSIRERPDRRLPFEVRWREEGRHRSRSFATEKEAIRFEGKVAERAAMGAHQPGEPNPQPLREWLLRWFDIYGPAWAESTQIQREDLVDRHIIPMLGGVRLRDLGRRRVVTFRRDLAAKATPQTVNAVMRVLSACLKDAVEEGLIPGNPCRGIRPLPSPPVERRPIPLDVVDELLRRTQGRDRLIVALLCYAGLRPGEVRALRWSDVGPNAIYVGRAAGNRGVKRTKSGNVRVVPIRDELAEVLDNGMRKSSDLLVTPGERGGLLSWHNWTSRVWRPARAGLGDWVPYEGRHTYASLLIAEKADPVQVASWMGHASAVVTLRHYSHLFALRDDRDPSRRTHGQTATPAPPAPPTAPSG